MFCSDISRHFIFELSKMLNAVYKCERSLFLHNPNIVLASCCSFSHFFGCGFVFLYFLGSAKKHLCGCLAHSSVTPTAHLSVSLHLPLCRLAKAVFHQPFHPPYFALDRSSFLPSLSLAVFSDYKKIRKKSHFSHDSILKKTGNK